MHMAVFPHGIDVIIVAMKMLSGK